MFDIIKSRLDCIVEDANRYTGIALEEIEAEMHTVLTMLGLHSTDIMTTIRKNDDNSAEVIQLKLETDNVSIRIIPLDSVNNVDATTLGKEWTSIHDAIVGPYFIHQLVLEGIDINYIYDILVDLLDEIEMSTTIVDDPGNSIYPHCE
jgi:hypothetical protein